MSLRNRVTILGAGAGGCALAFHMSKAGYEVLLYQDKNHLSNVEEVMETREIKAIEMHAGYRSALSGKTRIAHFSTNIKQACMHSDLLILVVPAFAQTDIFESALPYLTPNHIFLSLSGNFAVFDYLDCVRRNAAKINVDSAVAHVAGTPVPCTLVESSIIPYACRKIKNNCIFIGAIKQFIFAGAFPPSKTDTAFERLDDVFERSLSVRLERTHLLATPFYNSNLILHPTIVMCNSGHIKCQNKGFHFYKDGVSPLVCKMFEMLDKELLVLGRSVGFNNLESFTSYYRRYYGDKTVNTTTLSAFFQGAHFLHFVKAPNDLSGRFISEDLQYVLMPMVRFLARRNQVPTPLADSIFTSIQCMLGHSIQPLRDLPENEWNAILSSSS